MTIQAEFSPILTPSRLYTRADILVRACPVPAEPGIYGWYFREAPPRVPTKDCHYWQKMPLLYVGISPKLPPQNGRSPSRQRVRQRVRYHLRGNAAGSTLRLTLGCLLEEHLAIQLCRVGSGERYTFADGEAKLSDWMAENARVVWMSTKRPWEAEQALIDALVLPLNLAHNARNTFRAELSTLRVRCRARADAGPIWRPV